MAETSPQPTYLIKPLEWHEIKHPDSTWKPWFSKVQKTRGYYNGRAYTPFCTYEIIDSGAERGPWMTLHCNNTSRDIFNGTIDECKKYAQIHWLRWIKPALTQI